MTSDRPTASTRAALLALIALLAILTPSLSAAAGTEPGTDPVSTTPAPRPVLLSSAPVAGGQVNPGGAILLQFDAPASVNLFAIPESGRIRVLPLLPVTDPTTVSTLLPDDFVAGQRFRLVVTGVSERPWQRTLRFVAGAAGPATATEVPAAVGTMVGSGGQVHTFSIQVHRRVSEESLAFVRRSMRVLTDPRGWTGAGRHQLLPVDDPKAADIRLLLAPPKRVDRLCRRDGLDTGGRVSCWNGEFAALNINRWRYGALGGGFRSLWHYHQYLISHEFGHGLGYKHAQCPRPGALANVMQQQTGGQAGCRANGWPYPDLG